MTDVRMLSLSSSIRAAYALFALAALNACGPRPEGAAPTAQPSEESYVTVEPFEMHFNAVRSDTLSADVARAYGIERSKNRVLLNVTLMRKTGTSERQSLEGAVIVAAHNLNGQFKKMEMRRISEGSAIYYIGEASISGQEILVFDIQGTPANETVTLNAKLKREFFAE